MSWSMHKMWTAPVHVLNSSRISVTAADVSRRLGPKRDAIPMLVMAPPSSTHRAHATPSPMSAMHATDDHDRRGRGRAGSLCSSNWTFIGMQIGCVGLCADRPGLDKMCALEIQLTRCKDGRIRYGIYV